jgi:phage FluMu gp28-like protein
MKIRIQRTPVGKRIKRTPALGIKRTPVSGPLLLIRKNPKDDPKDFSKTMKETRERAKKFIKDISSETGYIERLTQTNLEPTKLYSYQDRWMRDRSRYRHCDKSRQIGMSYNFACEGYAKAQLLEIYTGLFVSVNQEEANNKIQYARALNESTPHKYRKKLAVDRVTALEWESKTTDGQRVRTRLISHPQREPRGKGYNTDAFLDEFAHFQWPEKIYIAAVPIITRGFGQLSLASSPLGKAGLHYEIGANKDAYSMYSRHKIFWWDNPDFLNEDALKYGLDEISRLSIDMETSDRVLEFGNDAIQQAYHSMLEEYFQQEYELKAIDEQESYFPMDLIKQCTFEALRGFETLENGDIYGDHPVVVDSIYPGIDFKIYGSPESLSHAIYTGAVGKRLFAGFDVGRKEDKSEIVILEEKPNETFLQIVRLFVTMKRTEFRKQFETIENLFKILPISKLRIDSTGMGKNLAEDLQRRFRSRIDDINFNNENKAGLATNLRLRMEDRSIAFPNDKDLIRQIHSIKRKITEGALVKFEADPSERRMHHGDKFWALALASSAGEKAQMYRVRLVSSDVISAIKNTRRVVELPPTRVFRASGMAFGMNYKNFGLPPNHQQEFQKLGALISGV